MSVPPGPGPEQGTSGAAAPSSGVVGRAASMVRDRTGPLGRKAIKYAMVSAVGVVVTQAVLVFTHGILGWPGAVANVTAVSVAAVPAYLLNRYWVWRKTDRNRLMGEVVPFWVMTIAGLALSTLFVAIVDSWTGGSTLAVSFANLAGFGVLWVAKFLVLERWLFGHHPAPVPGEA